MFEMIAPVEKRFKSVDSVFAFTAEEKRETTRVGLKDLWRSGARFKENGQFGTSRSSFGFNKYGLRSLCGLAGISDRTIQKLNDPTLPTSVLNDLICSSLENGGRANTADLVVNKREGAVIGVVSEKYVSYNNDEFLRDVFRCLDERNNGAIFPDTGNFLFKEAYSINSRLFLRLVSKNVTGVIEGRGGNGSDVSEIGVEISNSMAGGHAVSLSWFIHRLICANGLTAKVDGTNGRIIHAGNEEGFRKRLNKSANHLFSNLGKAKKLVETLGSIPFNPIKLAKHIDQKVLFSMLPDRDLKAEALSYIKCQAGESLIPPKASLERTAELIAALPFCIGGGEALSVFGSPWRDEASMYDLINIFTAYAKILSKEPKLELEAKAGDLAVWVSKNKRKLS